MEIKKMATTYEYKNIYILRYNNGERNFKNERTVFNAYELEEVLGEEATKEIFKQLQAKLKLESEYFDTENITCDITTVSVNLKELDKELNAFRKELYEQAETVSGDDDSYDYFPDLVYSFLQICEAVDRKSFYNETIKEINRICEYTDEDDELYFHQED